MSERGKLFTSRQQILDHYSISRYLFAKFVKNNMPVIYIDGRCYAHQDNLDEYFRQLTRQSSQNVPEEILNADD